MKSDSSKIGVLLIVFALVVAVLIIKVTKKREAAPLAPPTQQNQTQASLPQVLDLGRGMCVVCKKMVPIMEELKKEYKGRVVVKVINIDQQPEVAEKFKIRLIPTQIFLDAKGKEVFRHEGFMPKDEIVAQLKEMGIEPPTAAETAPQPK